MADNQLQLVILVDAAQGNAEIKKFNVSLDGLSNNAIKTGHAAHSAATGIDSMALSMAKGMVVGQAISGVLMGIASGIKALTVDSALYAARAETLGIVIDSLARVNGINVAQTRATVEAVRSQGIALNEARESVARMIGVQLDLSKATQLARVSQDAAVIAGVNSSEAFAGIVNGIVTQQVRVLRTYGIMVNFQRAFAEESARVGHELSETEKKNVALNEVLRFGAGLFGTYEAAMSTAGKEMTSLKRLVDDAKNALGEQFLPVTKEVVGTLILLAEWARATGKDFAGSLIPPVQAVIGLFKGLGFTIVQLAAYGEAFKAVWDDAALDLAKVGYAYGLVGDKTLAENQRILDNTKKRFNDLTDLIDKFQKKAANIKIPVASSVKIPNATGINPEDVKRQEEALKRLRDQHQLLAEMQKQGAESLKRYSAEEHRALIQSVRDQEAMIESIKKTSPYLKEQASLAAVLEAAQHSQRESDAAETQQRIGIAEHEAEVIKQAQQKQEEAYKHTFDMFKHEAGGVFDALLTKSQSIWSAIGNSFKTAMLSAIKDVVTSRIAASLMQIFGGVRVGFSGGTAGIGATPSFASTGAAALSMGAMAVAPGGFGIAGPGGTAPFIPSQESQGSSSLFNMAKMGSGFKSLLGQDNASQFGGGLGGTIAGGLTSPLAATAGLGLFMSGAGRGGWSGLGMSTLGGFMSGAGIGMMVGGPIGAGIGAMIGTAVGAITGLVGLFRQSAVAHTRDLVKKTYGVDISDKGVLNQIVEIAKQSYGGAISLAIQSPQVRELVQLYGITTGQNGGNFPKVMTPSSLIQSGQGLFQAQSTLFGTPVSSPGGLSTISLGGTVNSGASNGTPVQIIINGDSAAKALRGEVAPAIIANPRAVQSASLAAMSANSGRRESLAKQISPGTLVS